MKLILGTSIRPLLSVSAALDQKYSSIVDNLVALCGRMDHEERQMREGLDLDDAKPVAPAKTEKELKLEKLHAAHALIDKMKIKLHALEDQHAKAKTQAEKNHLKNMIVGIKKRCNEINAPFAIGGKPIYKIED